MNIHREIIIDQNEVLIKIVKGLREQGYETLVHVPCSVLNIFIKYCESEGMNIITATDEGEAVAIITGMYMAGSKAILGTSNAGIGNIVNPISTLAHLNSIPILMIVSYRGYNDKDLPQHRFSGSITRDLLEILEVDVYDLAEYMDGYNILLDSIRINNDLLNMTCILLQDIYRQEYSEDISTATSPLWDIKYPSTDMSNESDLKIIDLQRGTKATRYETIESIVKHSSSEAAFISTTGHTSRDLYDIHHSSRNFYMVGSLGYASAIGLGVAIYSPKQVIVLDGDGALLMRMGNLATIGYCSPDNLVHILLNNHISESTGGHGLSSPHVDFANIASSCNYRYSIVTDGSLDTTFEYIKDKDGPIFIECKLERYSNKVSPRLSLDFPSVARDFSKYITPLIT